MSRGEGLPARDPQAPGWRDDRLAPGDRPLSHSGSCNLSCPALVRIVTNGQYSDAAGPRPSCSVLDAFRDIHELVIAAGVIRQEDPKEDRRVAVPVVTKGVPDPDDLARKLHRGLLDHLVEFLQLLRTEASDRHG